MVELENKTDNTVEELEKCKKCGKKLSEEDIVFMGYCEKCYNKYVDNSVSEYNEEDTENISQNEYCGNCGKIILENNRICKHCGVDTTNIRTKNYCENCGTKIKSEEQVICLKCNAEIEQGSNAPFGLKVICFLFCIVGLIIYACNISKNKKYAKQCGKASLYGIAVPIIITIIIVVTSGIVINGEMRESSSKLSNLEQLQNDKGIEDIIELGKTSYSITSGNFSNNDDIIEYDSIKSLFSYTQKANIPVNYEGIEYTSYEEIQPKLKKSEDYYYGTFTIYSREAFYNIKCTKDKKGHINKIDLTYKETYNTERKR